MALGFFYYVSKDNPVNGIYDVDYAPKGLNRPPLVTAEQQQQSLPGTGRIFGGGGGGGGGISNSMSTGGDSNGASSNLGLTIASSTTTFRYPWSDEEPLVDKETKSIEDLILEAAATIRNIPPPPYILAKDKDGPKYFRNSSCARFPTIYDLEFSNTYWQVISRGFFFHTWIHTYVCRRSNGLTSDYYTNTIYGVWKVNQDIRYQI